MGCRQIVAGSVLFRRILTTNNKSIPANSGSVGKNISMGNPGTSSDSGMESGTRKTNANNSLSSVRNRAKTNNKTKGDKVNRYTSL